MNAAKIISKYNLDLFVKDIFIFENKDSNKKTLLPFFADGYPGIIYLKSENKAFFLPRGKTLSTFFLYGQTIAPVEFSLNGTYLLIVFQLYPFASKLLFEVNPKSLNDDCYNLSKKKELNINNLIEQLSISAQTTSQINIIAKFISTLAQEKGMEKYLDIQRAIEIIVNHKGLIRIYKLTQILNISERTLQRMFSKYVGIPPKKYAKVIQFQSSVEQISAKSYSKLTDVVYENGYSDQSHFIRNIKKFTGKKPLQLKP